MKRGVMICMFGGFALAAWVLLQNDADAIAAALVDVGPSGFVAAVLIHLVPITICALAWRTLLDAPRPGPLAMLWARLCRDAAGDLLGFVPAAGEILSLRALAILGVGTARAAAATVVDLSLELTGQLGFTAIGLGLLAWTQPGSTAIVWAVAGLSMMAAGLLGFLLAQWLGVFSLLDRLPERILADWSWLDRHTRGIQAGIAALWNDRRRLLRAGMLHLSAWLIGTAEAWMILASMSVWLNPGTVIALESLVFALRAIAFFVPGAIGVQEAGYLALFAAMDLPAEAALALALVKRGRELAIGLPVLGVWQWQEARRRWRASTAAAE